MPILETHPSLSRTVLWPDEAACASTAAVLATALQTGPGPDALIELHGPLGAGKTTFARHLLQALGVSGRVKSPTYALMEPYEIAAAAEAAAAPRASAWHFDFYRFDDPQEWEDAGFRELFAAPGLKLVEWPENAAGLLPMADLQLFIEPGLGDRRTARLVALTPRGAALLR